MKLYSFKGKAKVALCVMSMVQSDHNSGMRFVFSILGGNHMYSGMPFLSGYAMQSLAQAIQRTEL